MADRELSLTLTGSLDRNKAVVEYFEVSHVHFWRLHVLLSFLPVCLVLVSFAAPVRLDLPQPPRHALHLILQFLTPLSLELQLPRKEG